MPVDPRDLPAELHALAPAITIRMQRAGKPMGRPPGVSMDLPVSWVEVTFDPASPALPDSVRARLIATLGSPQVVRLLESRERSASANREAALEQLKVRLGPFLASGR
jgi:hypothetical protein